MYLKLPASPGQANPESRASSRRPALGAAALGASAIAMALGASLLLSGCGSFFSKSDATTVTTPTTPTTPTTGAGDFLYVANANSLLNTVAGFSLASGVLTGTTSSPYLVGVTPSSLALTPSNSILYVGSTLGGIYGFTVGSDGALTSNAIQPASVSPAAMAVDSTGQWLIVIENGLTSTNPSISAFPIDATTGALSSAVSTVQLDAGTSAANTSLLMVPNSSLVYAALGTGGVEALNFDSTTGMLTSLNLLLSPTESDYSDNGLASDLLGKFLFVSETGTNGIRSFTINTDGSLTVLPGSPNSAGMGPGPVLVDKTGAFLYTANKVGNSVSAYTLSSAGALAEIAGSPFPTGSSPIGMAEDSSKGYLAVICTGGSPDLQLLSINATTGVLAAAINQSTGSSSPAGAYAIAASN